MLGDGTPLGAVCAFSAAPAHAMALDLLLLRPLRPAI
jgi:hypothetical protein